VLPASAATRLDEEEARRFLERLTGRPHQLDLLRATAVLAPRSNEIEDLASRWLPDLLRVLPSRNKVVTREWEGGFHGRLDIRRTLAAWLGGSRSTFVTSARRRDYSLPENVLVRAVLERLVWHIANLRHAGVLSNAGWGNSYVARESALRRMLQFSGLADVEKERIESRHLEAAQHARHPCYAAALRWWQVLEDGLQSTNPSRIARIVSEGALQPLARETRFELAVLARLVEALDSRLCGGGGWKLELCLVAPDRDEVALFTAPSGARIRVFHNQAVLPPGPAELGARHYLAQTGRMRPDVTLTIEEPGKPRRAHVFEVKLSDDPGYVLSGFHEALLYANEYAAHLTGWPKAVLVASSLVPGTLRETDYVIAVDWNRWVPGEVVDGIIAGLAV
jgi:hypothetical protein